MKEFRNTEETPVNDIHEQKRKYSYTWFEEQTF